MILGSSEVGAPLRPLLTPKTQSNRRFAFRLLQNLPSEKNAEKFPFCLGSRGRAELQMLLIIYLSSGVVVVRGGGETGVAASAKPRLHRHLRAGLVLRPSGLQGELLRRMTRQSTEEGVKLPLGDVKEAVVWSEWNHSLLGSQASPLRSPSFFLLFFFPSGVGKRGRLRELAKQAEKKKEKNKQT